MPISSMSARASASSLSQEEQSRSRLANSRRHIDPCSGRALEILGHAIEYLTDELTREGGLGAEGHGPLDAVQILMAANRQIYFACPVQASLRERIFSRIRKSIF